MRIEAAGQSAPRSDEADLTRALRRARRAGLFARLDEIYASLPATTCEGCARCCFESPGIFFVEYLALIERLLALPESERTRLLRAALRELLFSWIDPDRQCLFLEGSRCSSYATRPLACRLFGLVAPSERDQAEAQARLAAREEVRRLGMLGIRVPEEVVQRALASCDRVRDERGRPVRVDADPLAARVARLDEHLLPREVVVEEFCFRSLPERLGAAALGREAIELMQVQLMRRAQRGESTEDILDRLWESIRLPAPLAEE